MDRSFLLSGAWDERFSHGNGQIQENAKGGIRHGMQSVWQEACPPAAAVFAYIRGQMLDKMDNK